jgi:transposase
MRATFTPAFKQQAVEKALRRSSGVTFNAVADTLGVGHSTLQRWVVEARHAEFNLAEGPVSMHHPHEKKPHEWSLEERFQMIVQCAPLDKEAMNQACRERGVYPHHIEQWRRDFLTPSAATTAKSTALELKKIKSEFSAVKKELNRKEKALAEAAALLVLQKKVNGLWSSSEDDSQ